MKYTQFVYVLSCLHFSMMSLKYQPGSKQKHAVLSTLIIIYV